ncbi:MAG: rhomboid family intramembrane serine protease, partial [Candidatus Pacebacteria bacterium]|nr:rhomboid family intramembrane serine protease [Candidatus Paceibacterota bacterium]
MAFKFYAVWLSAVCVAVFILQTLFSGFTDLFVLNSQSYWEFWRFLTAIFLHSSLIHLIYNLFALLLFGSIVERLVGEKRFLIIFFVSGVLANLVSVSFYPSSLGASGAIFGVIGALIIIRPTMAVFAFGLPMPMFLAGILW